MTYSRRTTTVPPFIFMRVLIISTLLLSHFYCSSQVSESSHASSFVLGVSLHQMLSSNNEARRYSLKTVDDGYYADVSNEHRSSQMLKVTGEFQFVYWYVRGGLSLRTEHTSIEALNIEEYKEVNSGQTNDAEVHRTLHINEKTKSQLFSIEVGSYFFKRDRPFRFGMGAGFDFCRYRESKTTGWNQVNKEQRIYHTTTFPQEIEINESKHLPESEEWDLMVRNVSMPLVVPKISLKASYRIYDNLSVSFQARTRFLVLQLEVGKAKMVFEFPVGIGFHYHFLN